MHVIQAPQFAAPAPMPYAPMAPPAMPPAPMFEETRRGERHVTTDSDDIPGGARKPWLLIGGGVGAVALIVIIVMMMRSKDEPKVAATPSKPTPERVEPVVKPPPEEVVAVVTPDAAEPSPPPEVVTPPRTGRTSPDPRIPLGPEAPKTPKTPRIRGTKTPLVETGKATPAVVGTDTGEKSAKAQAAYKAGNQKLFAGDASGAIVAYRQVIAVGSSSGYRGLGLAYAQQGDTANAIAAFKKYLQLSPKAADAALIKKRIAALQGK